MYYEAIKNYACDSLFSFDSERLQQLGELLTHPLSACFLHLKWQMTKWAYYWFLFCHVIFSIVYTTYVLLLYNTICRPLEWKKKITKLPVGDRLWFNNTIECLPEWSNNTRGKDEFFTTGAGWYEGYHNSARILWFVLFVFAVFYAIRELAFLITQRMG